MQITRIVISIITKTPFATSNRKQVEFVWTPDLLRVKLINLGIGKAIEKGTWKHNKTGKKFS